MKSISLSAEHAATVPIKRSHAVNNKVVKRFGLIEERMLRTTHEYAEEE